MRLPNVGLALRRVNVLAIGLPAAAAVVAATLVVGSAPATPQEDRTLLGILSEWEYPGSKMLGGATMSDGGNSLLPSVKCQAVLTTADPIEKVIAFYAERTGAARDPRREGASVGVKAADAKSVSMQDDSEGRPIILRIIVVNTAETATTLVISRSASEKETHIAWSHYLRLDGKR